MGASIIDSKPKSELEKNPPSKPPWKIKLLYDGECPLCLKEVDFLTRRDAGQGAIKFVDISDLNYDPDLHGGVDYATAMGRIHAVLSDGTVIEGIEVFQRIYEALGMGWVYSATKWPIIGTIADKIYDTWAMLRLRLTGRPDLVTLTEMRAQRHQDQSLGRCRLEGRNCD